MAAIGRRFGVGRRWRDMALLGGARVDAPVILGPVAGPMAPSPVGRDAQPCDRGAR